MQNVNQIDQTKHDLDTYPPNILSGLKNTIVTFGDMHGNALKLLYVLITYGVVSLPNKKNYKKFADLYNTLSKSELEKFDRDVLAKHPDEVNEMSEILKTIQYCGDSAPEIRLLGDVIGDRGLCDAMTISLLNKIPENKLTILTSDHDADCLYEISSGILGCIHSYQKRSLTRTKLLFEDRLKEGSTTKDQVLFDTLPSEYKKQYMNYGAKQKLLDYDIIKGEVEQIDIFSHAPATLIDLALLGKTLYTNFCKIIPDELKSKLIPTIDINKLSAREIATYIDVLNQTYTAIYNTNETAAKVLHNNLRNPAMSISWNRTIDPANIESVSAIRHWVHGHLGGPSSNKETPVKGKYINIDNDFGKYYGVQTIYPDVLEKYWFEDLPVYISPLNKKLDYTETSDDDNQREFDNMTGGGKSFGGY